MSDVFQIDLQRAAVAENAALWRIEQSLNDTFRETRDPKLATALADIAKARKSLASCVVMEGQEWDFLAALALSLELADFDAEGSA